MKQIPGSILKKARENRNLTLEQVSFATKIKTRYLEALEKELYDLIPSEVQARGFQNIYSDYLGISQADLHESEVLDLDPDITSISKSHFPDGSSTEIDQQDNPQNDQISYQGIFKEIGLTLNQQRDRLGLTSQDVEDHIHIRRNYVETIENGKFEDLPSLVQSRGMLNIYAKFLEIDSEEIMLKFAEALQLRREAITVPKKNGLFNRSHSQPAPSWRRFLTIDMLTGSSFVLVLLFFLLWGAAQISANQSSDVAPISGFEELTLETQVSTPVGSEPENAPPTESIQLDNSPQNDIEASPPQQIPTSSAPIQLNIIARERSFLRITADSQVVFNGRTIPGNAYSFSANERAELITGNAAAIQVIFNQSDIGQLGLSGQVRNIIFLIEGYQTPTPRFTLTSTTTPTVTATQSPTIVSPSATITPFIP